MKKKDKEKSVIGKKRKKEKRKIVYTNVMQAMR